MCRFLGYLFNFELIYEPLLKNKIKIVHTKFIILPSFNGKTTTASILFLEEACSGCSGNASLLYWGINVPSFTAKMGPLRGEGWECASSDTWKTLQCSGINLPDWDKSLQRHLSDLAALLRKESFAAEFAEIAAA